MKKIKEGIRRCFPKYINSREEVKIPCYDPNATITTPHYKISVNLSNLLRNFETDCKSYLKNAKPDSENGSYMDQVIDMTVAESVSLIKCQRQEHIKLIEIPLNNMHTGDFVYCKQELEARKKNLIEIRKELARVNNVFYRGTSFEGGDPYGNDKCS